MAFHEIAGLEIENERGFSGVVAAVGGLLFMYILDTFQKKQADPIGVLCVGIYLSLLLISIGIITGRYLAVLMCIVIFTATIIAMRTTYVARFTELREWYDRNPNLGLWLLVAMVVSAWAFTSLLPSSMISESGAINLVAHGVGLVFGILVAHLIRYRYDQSTETNLVTA